MERFNAEQAKRTDWAILRILANENGPLGARIIARRLRDVGVFPTERAVRHRLCLLDGRGFTESVGRREGRRITASGLKELDGALVREKMRLVSSKIELLSHQTTFDTRRGKGLVPINTTLFPLDRLSDVMRAMEVAFNSGLCAGDRLLIAYPGQRLSDLVIPEGTAGIGTVCSIVLNGCLLGVRVPMDARFAGLLEMRESKPRRFIQLVEYSASSIDPSEIFIRGELTGVRSASTQTHGAILANYREIPAICQQQLVDVSSGLRKWGMDPVLTFGDVGQAVCEWEVGVNKIGIVLKGGLNPVAAAIEMGIWGNCRAMSGVVEYEQLRPFGEMLSECGR